MQPESGTSTSSPRSKGKKAELLNAPNQQAETSSSVRAMPSAIDAEKSLLSTMMQEPGEFIPKAIERKLTSEHFYAPAHRILYELITEFYDKGQPLELVAINQALLDRKLVNPLSSKGQTLDRSLSEEIGGPAKVVEIYGFSATSAHFDYHLDLVIDKFVLRSVIKTCTESITRAFEDQEEVPSLIDSVEQAILAIREGRETNEGITTKEAVDEVIESFERLIHGKGEVQGLKTGYEELDKKSNGLKAGDMFIIAARPSMGKTSFVMNIVENVCLDQNLPVMVFSCEMPTTQLVQRLLFSRAQIVLSKIQQGLMPTKLDFKRFKNAASDIANAKLFIDDTPGISINELRAKARRKKRESDIQLIAVDYLQLMRSLSKQAQNSREREVAEISAGLKAIAKELKIPIIVLAQLNRGPENRTGKSQGVPRMSDLRESGSIEQDADMVGLLYREAYYDDKREGEGEENEREDAHLLLAKNRNGPTGDVPLRFVKELMRFETRELDPNEAYEE